MIDFEPTEEQKMLATAVHRFADERLRKHFRDAEEEQKAPAEVVQAGWEIGLLPTSIPEEFGGFGEQSAVTSAIAIEEFAWGDLALALHILQPGLTAVPIMLQGTEAQKEAYLPRYCDERPPKLTAALTEMRIQYDPRQLQTTAVRETSGEPGRTNGHYKLSGVKTMVPAADSAEEILVYANEDGRTQAFFVPRDTEGLVIGEREPFMGVRALPMFEVTLGNCLIPAASKLGGEEGIDFDLILNHSRVALGAAAVGVARAAFEYARDYAKQRVQFGEPIAHRQSIAFMLADMAIDVEAARLMVWEAAWLLDQGKEATREVTVMKHYVDDAVLQVADRAVQVLGGYGYIREYPVELWLRNARGFAHFDGLAIC
jgi:acyl-CoA dehydrogenase